MTHPFRSLKCDAATALALALVLGCGSMECLPSESKAERQQVVKDRDAYLRKMPPHAIFFKEKLYGFFEAESAYIVSAFGTRNPSLVKRNDYVNWPSGIALHIRHHIAHGCLWRSTGGELRQFRLDELHLFDGTNPDWEKQYAQRYPKYDYTYPEMRHGFTLLSLARMYGRMTFEWRADGPGKGVGEWIIPDTTAGFGVVPTSVSSCKSFILPRDTKQLHAWDSEYSQDTATKCWKPKPAPGFAKLGQWLNDLDSPSIKKRMSAAAELESLGNPAKSALQTFIASKPSDEARSRAQELLEKANRAPRLENEAFNYESFPSLFVEDFYVFLRKQDYYFVTESGKLYVAPPPADGAKTRTMKPLWTDAKRPINAVIEDADQRRVWLFAKDKDKGGKDVYFEIKETIRPETFNAAKLRPVNIEGRAKMMLEYLQLLPADKK